MIPGWLRIVLLLALCAGLYVGEQAIEQRGWNKRDVIAKADEQRIREESNRRLVAAMEDKLKLETALHEKFDAAMTERTTKEKQYENRIAAYEADARAGRLRLSVAIARCPVPGNASGPDPAIAGGTGAEARADILPDAAAAILRAAGDSARNVRDYNRVLDLYEEARSTCNTVAPH